MNSKSIRISDRSELEKQRKVNTSSGCYLIRKYNKKIELLIVKKVWPSGDEKYVLPKGHVEGDETLEKTAFREVMEETGYIDFSLLCYLGSSTYELDWSDIIIKTDHYFLAILDSEKQDGLKPEIYEEGVIVENLWMDIDKAFKLLTFENNPEIHESIKQFLIKMA